MKKGYLIILVAMMSMVLSSCSNQQEKNISVNENELSVLSDFQESKSQKEKLIIEEINIPIPENGNVNSFCVYKDRVYYSIEFGDYLMGQMEIGGEEIAFEEKYNTQIHVFHIGTKEDKILYQYKENECVSVSDIQSNGTEVIWEEYKNGTWNVRLVLENEVVEEPLIAVSQQNTVNLETDIAVSSPIANEKLCIWMKGYDYHERQELYCFDREKQTAFCMPTAYTFAYEVLGDMILLNQEDEIICYDIKNMERTALTEGGKGYGFLFAGIEGNIYAEIFDSNEESEELHIINIKAK